MTKRGTVKNIQFKSDVEVYPGGNHIDLEQEERGAPLKQRLTTAIEATLDKEIDNQKERIEKLRKWQKIFKGIRGKKSFPYAGASNMAVPVTRWLTETLFVRIVDALFSQKRFFMVEPRREGFGDVARQLEDSLEWWQSEIAKLRKNLYPALQQCVKMGTGLIKLNWDTKKRTIYRRATDEELENKDVKVYRDRDGNDLVKDPVTYYDGVTIHPISREDWIQSGDAIDLEESFLCGFRKYLRPAQFQARVNKGMYPELSDDEVDSILTGGQVDETKKSRAEDQYKLIEDNLVPQIDIWELWMKYDVDGDGEEDDVVVTWNNTTGTICQAIYNPYYYGCRPFQKFIFAPVEYSSDGEGTCEILEPLQNEIDTLHNQRIDRANQLNAPVWLRDTGMIQGDIKVHPGAIIDVAGNPENTLIPLLGHPEYPDTARIEMMDNQYAMQAVGVSPANMGQSMAERPVARDTLALIQETNKKFKAGIDNLRFELSEFGMKVLEMMAQYAPTYSYKTKDGDRYVERQVNIPGHFLRDGLGVQISASSEVMNTEVRRQIDLTLYQLLGDYATKMTGMANALANPNVPPAVKKYIAEVGQVSSKLIKDIVRDFGKVNEDELVVEWDNEFFKQLQQPSQQQQQQQRQQQQQQKMAEMQAKMEQMKQQGELAKGQQDLQGKQMDLKKGEQELTGDRLDLQKGILDIREKAAEISRVMAEAEKERSKK